MRKSEKNYCFENSTMLKNNSFGWEASDNVFVIKFEQAWRWKSQKQNLSTNPFRAVKKAINWINNVNFLRFKEVLGYSTQDETDNHCIFNKDVPD